MGSSSMMTLTMYRMHVSSLMSRLKIRMRRPEEGEQSVNLNTIVDNVDKTSIKTSQIKRQQFDEHVEDPDTET